MSSQTVSDELYRRHEREWAAMRSAIEAQEASQKQQDKASSKAS